MRAFGPYFTKKTVVKLYVSSLQCATAALYAHNSILFTGVIPGYCITARETRQLADTTFGACIAARCETVTNSLPGLVLQVCDAWPGQDVREGHGQ